LLAGDGVLDIAMRVAWNPLPPLAPEGADVALPGVLHHPPRSDVEHHCVPPYPPRPQLREGSRNELLRPLGGVPIPPCVAHEPIAELRLGGIADVGVGAQMEPADECAGLPLLDCPEPVAMGLLLVPEEARQHLLDDLFPWRRPAA